MQVIRKMSPTIHQRRCRLDFHGGDRRSATGFTHACSAFGRSTGFILSSSTPQKELACCSQSKACVSVLRVLTITHPKKSKRTDDAKSLEQRGNHCPASVLCGRHSWTTSVRRSIKVSLLTAIFLCASTGFVAIRMNAQDANEALGPKDSGSHNAAIPLQAERRTLRSSLLPELANVHPRVYFTANELDALRARAHGEDKAWWRQQLMHLRALQGPPPPPPAEKRRAQNDVAFAIAEAAFAYKIERDPKYLAAAK